MVKMPRKSLRKTYKKKSSFSKKSSSKKYSKKSNLKKLVKTVIHDQLENKQAWHNFNPTWFNCGINSAGDACRLIPDINQSTADNGRIGDQLRARRFNVKGHILFAPQGVGQSDSYRRIACRLMVVTPKTYSGYRSAIDNATTWMGYLLKKGGTTTGFTGLVSDLYSPINSDAITTHYDKIFYMNQPSLVSGTTSNTLPLDLSNTTKFFDISFSCKNKLVKYEASVDYGLTPTNAGYILLCGYVFLDGSSPDTVTTRIQLGYTSTIEYEDA